MSSNRSDTDDWEKSNNTTTTTTTTIITASTEWTPPAAATGLPSRLAVVTGDWGNPCWSVGTPCSRRGGRLCGHRQLHHQVNCNLLFLLPVSRRSSTLADPSALTLHPTLSTRLFTLARPSHPHQQCSGESTPIGETERKKTTSPLTSSVHVIFIHPASGRASLTVADSPWQQQDPHHCPSPTCSSPQRLCHTVAAAAAAVVAATTTTTTQMTTTQTAPRYRSADRTNGSLGCPTIVSTGTENKQTHTHTHIPNTHEARNEWKETHCRHRPLVTDTRVWIQQSLLILIIPPPHSVRCHNCCMCSYHHRPYAPQHAMPIKPSAHHLQH